MTFDEVSPFEYVLIQNGYGGLAWNNFFIQNGLKSSGFLNGAISEPNVAFNGLGSPAAISSTTLFTLESAYFTAVYVTQQQIRVEGFANGVRTYDNTYAVSNNAHTLINFNYIDVDTVRFTIITIPSGIFAMDNLVISVDSDNDGVSDDQDQCPNSESGVVVNEHGCSIEQLVPCAGPTTGGKWKNHGKYLGEIKAAADTFLIAELITPKDRDAIVQAAARSDCGKK